MNKDDIIKQIDLVINNPNKYLFQLIQFIHGYTNQNDPYLIILSAFYYSLSHNDLWKTYTKKQYKKARIILEKYIMKSKATEEIIFFALDELEAIGLEINPFEIDVSDEGE